MSYKLAKDHALKAQEQAPVDLEEAVASLAAALLELTKSTSSDLQDIKSKLDTIRSRVG